MNGALARWRGGVLPSIEAVDRVLLEKAGGTRVIVLPTASAPDGPSAPERWAKMSGEHFSRLGGRVDALLALSRADCALADFVAAVRAASRREVSHSINL